LRANGFIFFNHEINKDLQLGGGFWASSRTPLIYLDEVNYNVSVTSKEQWFDMEMLLVHRTLLVLDSYKSPRSMLVLGQRDLDDVVRCMSLGKSRLRNARGMLIMYTLS
jgi:hypothetical protein